MDHILSDLSSMTRPSWVAPRAWLNFIELDKAVVGRNDAKAETGEWSLHRCQSMNWSAKTLVKTLRGAVLKTSTAAQAQEGLEELSHDEGQEGRW